MMRYMIRNFVFIFLFAFLSIGAMAQAPMSERARIHQQANTPAESDIPWSRGIYRSIDLTVEKNMPIYFPEEPIEGHISLFRLIMGLLAENKIAAYEYLDGKELFTDNYKLKVKEMFDRFHIIYEEKGGSAKNPRFVIEESDVPSNEVLSYYVKEQWVFDQRTSRLLPTIEAICPVLHRSGDFGGEAMKFPMFWIQYETLRPFLAQHQIITSSTNNVRNLTMDDFFRLRLFDGEIYKTTNLRNMSLMQLYPSDSARTAVREEIENQLKHFDANLWVKKVEKVAPTSKEQIGKSKVDSVTTEVTKSKKPTTTVRSSRSSRGSVSTPKATKAPKQPKQSSTSSAPVRSVRRTR